MKRWDIGGAEDAAAGACAVARRFFEALSAGDLDAARALATAEPSWFGSPLDAAAWSSAQARAFFATPQVVHEVRVFPAEIARALPEAAGGPVPEDASIVLVDVTRAAARVTIGVMVRRTADGDVVARVFDPTALAEETRSRAEGADR